MTFRLTPLVLPALLFFGCSRGVQNESAVRQGVVDYLSTRSDLNMSQMQVQVTSVSFRQNEADATVSFRPKGGGADTGMQMRYTLERKGSRWVVKGRGAGPHSQAQPQAPASGQAPPQGGGMPPGHPPIGGGTPSEAPKK